MKFEHCLFGYDDGHRLLASSFPLGNEISLLTELSDLAPGTVFGNSKGYWTGVPVPSIGCYALMFTWPAPEMSRPGCVWTHALFIKPALFECLDDLLVLKSLFVRPSGINNLAFYKQPLNVNIEMLSANDESAINNDVVQELILSLYEKNNKQIDIVTPGEIDGALFAVWSQQWPRLRRNLRFQTAVSIVSQTSRSVRFDVSVSMAKSHKPNYSIKKYDSNWIIAAVNDISNRSNSSRGELRNFLWVYGQDVQRQRGSFRPLVEINIINKRCRNDDAEALIDLVIEAFPERNNGVRLKQDLMDGKLASPLQAELIRLIITNGLTEKNGFPRLTESGIDNLANFWPVRSEEIFKLIDSLIFSGESSWARVFDRIIDLIQTVDFWVLSNGYSRVREYVIKNRPDFLIQLHKQLDAESLITLIPFVTIELTEVSDFIACAIKRDNTDLVNILFKKCPEDISEQTIKSLDKNDINIASVWVQGLIRRAEFLLRAKVLSLVSRKSLLYMLADSLGWLSSSVKNAGIAPWREGIYAIEDLSESESEIFDCFLISLAIISNDGEGLRFVEFAYDKIHSKMLRSKLSLRGEEFLSPFLPDLGWFSNWDLAYRFRLAITKAYVRHNWPTGSYAALAKDKKGRKMLSEAASSIDGAQKYHDALFT